MMLRRRRVPVELEGPLRVFEALAPALDRARRAITSSVPSTRLPGRPLAETLLEYEEALAEVAGAMSAWRAPALEDVWRRADDSVRRGRDLAERLRVEAPVPAGFEGLIGIIGDLLEPLEAFADAEERFRELRRR